MFSELSAISLLLRNRFVTEAPQGIPLGQKCGLGVLSDRGGYRVKGGKHTFIAAEQDRGRALTEQPASDEEKADAEYDVYDEQQLAFEPGCRSVPGDGGRDERSDADGSQLDRCKNQIHMRIEQQADEDENGSDEQGNLQTAPDGDFNGCAHFVFHRQQHGRAMFGSVADDGYNKRADEQVRQAEFG